MKELPTHFAAREAEAIYILRDGVTETRNFLLLFSGAEDSTVLAHLFLHASYPAPPSVLALNYGSTGKSAGVLAFRGGLAQQRGFRLIIHADEDGGARMIDLSDHGDLHTTRMGTERPKRTLEDCGYEIVFDWAWRNEDAGSAKARIGSVRGAQHGRELRSPQTDFPRSFDRRLSVRQTIPGYGRIDVETGLPLEEGGGLTIMARNRVFGCAGCAHRDFRPPPDGRTHADPGHCPACNPGSPIKEVPCRPLITFCRP